MLKVTPLVEDAVVGEELLAIDARQPPVLDHGRGVVQTVVIIDEADDERKGSPCACRRAAVHDALERGQVVANKRRPEQQVLRRIAGDSQLRERDNVAAGYGRPAGVVQYLGNVPVEIADDGIDLSEADSQCAHS